MPREVDFNYIEKLYNYYRSRRDVKDTVVFKDMAKEFNVSVRTLKRYKKKFSWDRDVIGTKSNKERGDLNINTEVKKKEPKEDNKGKKKKDPRQAQKQYKEVSGPVTPIMDTSKDIVDSIRWRQGVEQVSEMLIQGFRPNEIKQGIVKKKEKDDDFWSHFSNGDIEYIVECGRESIINDNYIDVSLEAARFGPRMEYLFRKAIEGKDYMTALRVEVTKMDVITKIYGTINPDKIKSKELTNMSENDIIEELKKLGIDVNASE